MIAFQEPLNKVCESFAALGIARNRDHSCTICLLDQTPFVVWHENLKRYGMENRLEALERLSVWLALWYSGRSDKSSLFASSAVGDPGVAKSLPGALDEGDRHPLNTIFTPHLLRAMVAWGFKSEVSSPESTTAVRLGSSVDL